MAKCRYCNKEVHLGRYQHELYCIENPTHRALNAGKVIKNAWRFWNHCFLGRTRAYQPRKLKLEEERSVSFTCPRCGKLALSLVYAQDVYLFDWLQGEDGKILKFLSRYQIDLSGAVVEKSYDTITVTTKTHNIALRLNYNQMCLKIDNGKEETFHVQRVGAKLKVYDNIHDVCRSCKVEVEKDKLEGELEGERKKIRIKNLELAEQFHDLLDECEKKGTCDILAAHHELLKDDDQRLRTHVLLDMVCRNRYDDKWDEILADAKAKIESGRLEVKKRADNEVPPLRAQ